MMASYNYEEFSTNDYDFDSMDGVELGGKAKDFTLETTDGENRRLLDFSGEFLVLEMGSRTCPLFQSRRTIMQPLESEFSNLSFAVLYVREAHPGSNIPGHKSFEDKAICARQLKDADGETRTVFIDTFEGLAHQAYGSMPNAVFIINKNGCVVFRSDWNNPSSTRKALRELVEGRPITAKSFFRPALPSVAIRTMRNAGKGSAADFLKGLPFLVWTNIFKRNWRLLLNKPTRYSGETLC